MSFKRILAKVLVFAFLYVGALAGVPMDPKKIEELMNVMSRTKVVHVVKKDDPGR